MAGQSPVAAGTRGLARTPPFEAPAGPPGWDRTPVTPSGAKKLKPKSKKAKRKLIKLVKNGAKATAKIIVTLTDTAGNETSANVTVKLKK